MRNSATASTSQQCHVSTLSLSQTLSALGSCRGQSGTAVTGDRHAQMRWHTQTQLTMQTGTHRLVLRWCFVSQPRPTPRNGAARPAKSQRRAQRHRANRHDNPTSNGTKIPRHSRTRGAAQMRARGPSTAAIQATITRQKPRQRPRQGLWHRGATGEVRLWHREGRQARCGARRVRAACPSEHSLRRGL